MTRLISIIIASIVGLIGTALVTTVAGQAILAITSAKILNWLYPNAWYNPWTWIEVWFG